MSLTFCWNRASILTFQGRVEVGLLYVEGYHGRYKEWRLKEARLVEEDGLWLKCIFEKDVPKAEVKDVAGIDLNFNNITTASEEGINKMETTMFKKALVHRRVVEKVQKRYRGWRYIKAIRKAIIRHGRRMRNRVVDETRKVAKKIVKPSTAIALEDLRHIRADNGFSKLHLWAYRKLQEAMVNENEEHVNETVFVKARGTSSTCPNCGSKLGKSGYHVKLCFKCNKTWDGDEVGALNIRMRGLQLAPIVPKRMQTQEAMRGKSIFRQAVKSLG